MSGGGAWAEGGDHRLGDALEAWLRHLGQRQVGTLAVVCRCWDEVVGPEVAAHARPLALRGEALVVAVDHPAWATQMSFLAPGILARLAEELGRPVAARLEITVRRT